MKFLVITRINDSFLMVPPEMQMQLLEGTAVFIEKHRNAGHCKEIYNLPGMKGSASIWEVPMAEDGNQFFLESPLYPFSSVDMYVMSDFDAHVKAQKEALQQRMGG